MPVNTARATVTKGTKVAVDKMCYVASVFMPATALPQIYKLYATQDAASLSLTMWILYLIGVIPFLLFGIVHKAKQLIVLNVLWMIVTIVMIFGIVIYT